MGRLAAVVSLSCLLFLLSAGIPSAAQGIDPLMSRVGRTPPSALVPSPSAHAEQEGKVVFKSQTVLVQVPVIVTDKAGVHVHGLKKEDFKLLENGKEQKVTAFEEVSAVKTPLVVSPNPPNTFSNLALSPEQPRSITVIAVDTINTSILDQAYARRELIKYLAKNLDSGQVLGLVVIGSKGLRVLSGITNDPKILISALKKASGEIPAMNGIDVDAQAAASLPATGGTSELLGGLGPVEAESSAKVQASVDQFVRNGEPLEAAYYQSRAIETTMASFLDIAHSLAGIPGRKSLIWATGGFPFYLDTPSSVPGGDLSLMYERAMAALNEAQVSVYPVDARGLVNYLPAADGTIAPGSAADGISHGMGRTVQSNNRSWLQSSTIDSLKDFADMTGGRAFYNRNDIHNGFERAADDSASFYLVGFYLDTHNDKAGWRKLQVKVQRKDVEVRSRTGFFVTKATVDPAASRQLDISTALLSPFDSTGIPVTVGWQGVADAGAKKKVGFAIHVPANGVTFDTADSNRFDIDFVAQATKDGKAEASVAQVAKGALPPEKMAEIAAQGVRYSNALELPPGDYQVRFVVRDNLTGRVGSVSATLKVQ